MPLMGSLYIGASGLQTSQNALNTTAHNMSNIDTIGYSRQQVQLGTRVYNTISKNGSAVSYQQIGLGVTYSQVKQVRDQFLDKTYRKESGRSTFYEVSYTAMQEIENLFQELEGEAFSDSINNLWTTIQELSKNPENAVNQSVLIQRCNEFLSRAGAVYDGLCNYQDNLNLQAKGQVDQINAYGERLHQLNFEILKIEVAGVEHANDLKDQRNQILDELGALVNMSYTYDVEGNACVKIEGNDFVTAGSVRKIAMHEDAATGFYTPYWEQLATYTKAADGSTQINLEGATVFDMTQTISTEMNSDVGGLKATLLARGDRRGTYHDIEDVDTYNTYISQSVVTNIQAEFDQLVNKVTTVINDVFKKAAEDAGAYPGSTYMRDSNGDPYQIFNLATNEGGFTLGNIVMNKELQQSPSLLSFILPDGSYDSKLAENLKKAFEDEAYTLNPNVATKTNFINYYNSLISQVANSGSVMKNIAENQHITVESTNNAREQVTGVSSDEELSNMIMFQNAYNASSRYINVISEMLEHIINTLGM